MMGVPFTCDKVIVVMKRSQAGTLKLCEEVCQISSACVSDILFVYVN